MSRNHVIAGVLVGAAVIGGGIWLSQNAPALLSQSKTAAQGQPFEGWVLNCNEEAKKCTLSQTLMDSKTSQRVANIAIGNLGPKGESFMLINTPLGIIVAAGVAYKIDENEQVSVQVQHCTQEGCHAAVPVTAKLQKELAHGKILRLGIMAPDKQSLSLEFQLKGFKEALEAYHEKVTAFGPVTEMVAPDSQKKPEAQGVPAGDQHPAQPPKGKTKAAPKVSAKDAPAKK